MIGDALRQFFYAPQSAHAVALFRIAIGAVIAVNGLLAWSHGARWYGPDGVLPEGTLGSSRLSLLRLLPRSDRSVRLVAGGLIAAGAALSIGFATPIAAAVSFALLHSLHAWNPHFATGGEQVARVMCFLLVFSRAGDTLSVDRWLAGGDPDPLGPPWCERLMQIQLSLIYLGAATSKLRERSWRTGTALYFAVSNGNSARRGVPRRLRRPGLFLVAAWASMLLELALATLIWIPALRPSLVIAAVAFHLALEVMIDVDLFGATMIACWFLFV